MHGSILAIGTNFGIPKAVSTMVLTQPIFAKHGIRDRRFSHSQLLVLRSCFLVQCWVNIPTHNATQEVICAVCSKHKGLWVNLVTWYAQSHCDVNNSLSWSASILPVGSTESDNTKLARIRMRKHLFVPFLQKKRVFLIANCVSTDNLWEEISLKWT